MLLLPWCHIWVHSLILDRVCLYVQGQCHLGSMEELNLVVCMLESCPHALNARELAPAAALWRCNYTVTEAKQTAGRAGGIDTAEMPSSAPIQAKIQDSELSHCNIHPFYDLEEVKGHVLQIQSCSISMTQGNKVISEKSPVEDLVLIL